MVSIYILGSGTVPTGAKVRTVRRMLLKAVKTEYFASIQSIVPELERQQLLALCHYQNMNDTKTDLQEQSDDLAYFAKAIEHFETHDIGDELANSPEVHFEVNPQIRRRRYPFDSHLAAQLDSIAQQRGVATETLLDEWAREKIAEIEAVGAAK